VFINPDGHYLAAGELPLPAMYGAVCAAFVVALAVWLRYTRSHKADMHKLHHLMTLLVFLKVTSSLCQALMYHFIDTTGHSTGWSVAFYIATFFRGLLTVAVIALIGAGWSLLKPFLNDREKKVLMVALPLQVS
jgi:G protein-coupled receptor 107